MIKVLEEPKIKTIKELLNEYLSKERNYKGEKLIFEGVDGRDVYNITAPFEDEGELVIAGRVEARDSEYSDIIFFTCSDNVWRPRRNTISFKLQDPFVTRINGELVFGGVEVRPHPEKHGYLCWKTLFFRGKTINQLKYFAKGPVLMKDIRLIQLKDGRIGVFTRPHGKIGGRGTIGFTIINTLDELNPETIMNARLIRNQFIKEEWGGVNEAHLLKNGLIGALGHIACYDMYRNRHYYSIVFSLNPETGETSPLEIIAIRDDFEEGAAKKPDLADVIFSGGLIRENNGKATLYAGVSDAEAHRIVIPDPFIQYEI
ncbi:MAG: DUF1861 family protein [Clostridiaceae bacterium]|jgi:hypothetical protein|nr:DUF1861 family protein [Clostridiaceae bacterium]